MNTGQMLITIGALTLLSLVILRVNNNSLSTGTVINENKLGIMAISLGTSLMEEAKNKAFDENTVSAAVTSTSSLSTLGPESGEEYPSFDDFDDFNAMDRYFSYNQGSENDSTYKVKCSVVYIDPSDPETAVTTKTWHKKMIIEITSESMADTIELSTIFSYFYNR